MSLENLPSTHIRFAFALIMLWEDLMPWDEFVDDMLETFGDDYGWHVVEVIARNMISETR